MSAKGKMIELNRGVSDINMKRAYLSSIMLSVAIPVTVIAAYIGKWSAVSVRNIYIVVAVLMEIFQLVFMFVLKKQYGLDEFDRFHAIYTAYFYVTFVYLMLGAISLFVYRYNEESLQLYKEITCKEYLSRKDYQQIEQYCVQVYNKFERDNSDKIAETTNGIKVWSGAYSEEFGLSNEEEIFCI